MQSDAKDTPPPGSKVRVRVAGRPEVSEGVLERASPEGVVLQLTRPPELGVMTLVEFIGPNQTVVQRRTACMVFRRGRPRSTRDATTVALEFVDLVGGPSSKKESLIQRFARLFGRRQPGDQTAHQMSEPEPPREGPVIGIDLGTANSCAALVRNGAARLLGEGEYRTMPSVVHFDPSGRRRVGIVARDKMILEPTRTIFGSKRFLGRPFSSEEVRRWGHFFPYQLVQGAGGTTAVKIGHELHALEDVAREILVVLKQRSEATLGRAVNRAVISVPAYFGEPQRKAVYAAGRAAGFWVERLINEPTSAAVAYGYGREFDHKILVYDLGGGTFDVSVLEVRGDQIVVLATGGDPFLGGADFDDRLTEHVLFTFAKNGGPRLHEDPVAVQRVRFASELAKIDLSDRETTEVFVPAIQASEPRDLRVQITREQFQGIVGDLIDRTLVMTDAVLKDAGLKAGEIEELVLVGGQTRTPLVRERLIERFRKQPSRKVHPDEAVAMGAALIGASIEGGGQVELRDILSASIQWNVAQSPCQLLLPRGSRLPASATFLIPAQNKDLKELRLQLFRGEASSPQQNSFIGALNLDKSFVGNRARLQVSAEGLLSVEIERAQTGWMSMPVDFVGDERISHHSPPDEALPRL